MSRDTELMYSASTLMEVALIKRRQISSIIEERFECEWNLNSYVSRQNWEGKYEWSDAIDNGFHVCTTRIIGMKYLVYRGDGVVRPVADRWGTPFGLMVGTAHTRWFHILASGSRLGQIVFRLWRWWITSCQYHLDCPAFQLNTHMHVTLISAASPSLQHTLRLSPTWDISAG